MKNYDFSIYEKPSVTVDSVLFSIGPSIKDNTKQTLKVLMIKRENEPFKDFYSLPGGFIDINLSLDESVKKSLKEKVNIEDIYTEQLYSFGDLNRDERGRIISVAYMGLVNLENTEFSLGKNTSEISWFDVERKIINKQIKTIKNGYIIETDTEIILNNEYEEKISVIKTITTISNNNTKNTREIINTSIAFDHSSIIDLGIERLMNKVEYSDIAFGLLPELFTMKEVQVIFETILNRSLFDTELRRMIEKKLTLTTEKKKTGGRSSKVYKFNPLWSK